MGVALVFRQGPGPGCRYYDCPSGAAGVHPGRAVRYGNVFARVMQSDTRMAVLVRWMPIRSVFSRAWVSMTKFRAVKWLHPDAQAMAAARHVWVFVITADLALLNRHYGGFSISGNINNFFRLHTVARQL